jgi:ABC-type multidrug transport system fused ATPase/permease subunit
MSEYFSIFQRIQACSGVPKRRQVSLLFLTALTAAIESFSLLFLIPFFGFFNQSSVIETQENSKVTLYVSELLHFIGAEFSIVSVAFCLVLLIICREAVAITNQYCLRKFMGQVQKGVQEKLLNCTIETNFLAIRGLGTGKFLELCNTCPRECAGVLQSVTQIFSVFFILFSYFIVLFLGSPAIALIAVIVSVSVMLLLRYTVRKSRMFGEEIVSIRAELSQQFFGIFDQFREIKVSNNASVFSNQIQLTTSRLFTVFLRSVKVGLLVRSLLTILLVSFTIFLTLKLKESNLLDLTVLSTGLVMVMRLLPLVLNLTRIRQGFVVKVPFVSDLEKYFLYCEENLEGPGGQKIFAGLKSQIEFRNAEFSYPSVAGSALNKINAIVKKGQSSALVGSSGAGKSTFVDSLPRLIELGNGMLFLDGEDINSFSTESIRGQIAYVPQSPKLYDGPLWQNILPSKLVNYEKLTYDLLSEVGLEDLLINLPQGVDTLVGDAGVTLSGGQIQRIALARAIYKQANILILDEPTSSLDSANTRRIVSLIKELCAKKGVTVLVISHSWDVISKLDNMIKLDSGKTVYQGKPDYKVFALQGGSPKT